MSKNMIKIILAKKSELDWINACYDEIGFVHSIFDEEIIAIAEVNGQKAGIGRLVTIDEKNLELGGIYVFEDFRNQGVARKIVEFLLNKAPSSRAIYCIPFENLTPFYKQFGFIDCLNLEHVPKKLLKKRLWCQEKYTQPTSFLVMEKHFS